MAETTPNRGQSTTIAVYVEKKKLGGDFTRVTNFKAQKDYVEGEDRYLGKTDAEPWQVCTGASGSFDIEETDAALLNGIDSAITAAEVAGQKPDIVIVQRVNNSNGTTAKTTYPKCVVKRSTDVSGQFDKRKHSYTFKSSRPGEE